MTATRDTGLRFGIPVEKSGKFIARVTTRFPELNLVFTLTSDGKYMISNYMYVDVYNRITDYLRGNTK
jgi:hypothetical protein